MFTNVSVAVELSLIHILTIGNIIFSASGYMNNVFFHEVLVGGFQHSYRKSFNKGSLQVPEQLL